MCRAERLNSGAVGLLETASTVFVLVPAAPAVPARIAELLTVVAAARPQLAVRTYPPADDAQHLLSLVRAGRDAAANRRLRGMLYCLGGGAGLGAVTAGSLAAGWTMFGGLVGVAIAFGAVVGAFLGGFTAAMTGTESPRDEVRALARTVSRGSVLLTVRGPKGPWLAALRARCDELGWPWRQRD